MTRKRIALAAAFLLALVAPAMALDLNDEVEHGYADSNGVKIHYATVGKGPLVVMIHGFPDYWYSWRHQMNALKSDFQVVAIDQRGYNLSGQPKGVENYDMQLLVGDVAAVIRHLGQAKATIVGHDWGGAVAWNFAMFVPEMTERLVILNLPHPNGMAREMSANKEQQANSAYARAFQEKEATDPDVFFGMPMKPETLAGWVSDPEARKHYIEAFGRSDFTAMLNYYKRNYPRGDNSSAIIAVFSFAVVVVMPLFGEDAEDGGMAPAEAPRVKAPVLMFHGLEDTALHSDGLNNTWDWVDQDLTLVTVPGASHFVQQDAAELVSSTMKWWLSMDRE